MLCGPWCVHIFSPCRILYCFVLQSRRNPGVFTVACVNMIEKHPDLATKTTKTLIYDRFVSLLAFGSPYYAHHSLLARCPHKGCWIRLGSIHAFFNKMLRHLKTCERNVDDHKLAIQSLQSAQKFVNACKADSTNFLAELNARPVSVWRPRFTITNMLFYTPSEKMLMSTVDMFPTEPIEEIIGKINECPLPVNFRKQLSLRAPSPPPSDNDEQDDEVSSDNDDENLSDTAAGAIVLPMRLESSYREVSSLEMQPNKSCHNTASASTVRGLPPESHSPYQITYHSF